MSLARWIMDRATANPPRGREDWARAMQAEFDTLGSGRLGWALGCLRTMTGWRLAREWPFLVAVVALPLLISWEVGPSAIFALAVALPDDLFRALFFPLGFLGLASGSAALAFWRPDRTTTATVAGFVVSFAYGFVAMQQLNGWGSLSRWELYNAPPLVGGMAMLAACAIGAVAGAWIRRRVTPAAATASR